ncbi:unknown [Sulfolobus spindle-shaped virus 6]|uniref:C2H2-type domain-containing protein n=1 Tax=Sulfolobus spindle-shaped virus 6 TaxID=693627 RepID=D1GF43_9VIRU|nr:zinc-finger domain protein [Sulfolobus spindle-shaped virus 6]ACZ35744.1 unknown [Sulfolobus spindle-shaped virus 6]
MSQSDIKKYQNKGIFFHLSKKEYERYKSLPPEQKKLIRAVIKALIYNPDLLSEADYLFKLMQSKTVSPYVCPLCLTPFSSSVSLKQHIRYTEHSKVCPVCGKEFRNTDSTLDHVCKKHNICVS